MTQSVLITGGTSGLGLACARHLASLPSIGPLYLTGRDPAVVKGIADSISPKAIGMPLDLASLKGVRTFARDLPPVDLIICNAGLQFVGPIQWTTDGIEATFGVNHVAHFLLVNLLLEKSPAPSRIVLVSSGTHDPEDTLSRRMGMPPPRLHSASTLARPNPAETTVADGRRRYTTSKLCNLLFALELAKRLAASGSATTVNAFDPGLMPGTGLARNYSTIERLAWTHLLPVLRFLFPNVNTTEQSGAALARLVTDPALASVTGRYFVGKQQSSPSVEASSPSNQARLWAETEALLGELQ